MSFGKLAIRDKDEYQEENLKSYDSLYMKGTCYPECAITIDGKNEELENEGIARFRCFDASGSC